MTPRSHDSPESPDVEELPAHPGACLRCVVSFFFGSVGISELALFFECIVSRLVQAIEDPLLVDGILGLEIEIAAGVAIGQRSHGITNLAFDTDVGNETLEGLRIQPWQVTGVRVTIGIAVGYVKEVHEIVTPIDDFRQVLSGHHSRLLLVIALTWFDHRGGSFNG